MRGDIPPGTITNGKVSKRAGIELTKLEKGSVGQVPVVQSDGFQTYKTLSGDGSIDGEGVLTVKESDVSHSRLDQALEGQVLVAQSDGKFAAKTLTGDVTLTADGSTTSNVVTTGDGTTAIKGDPGPKGDTGPPGEVGPAGSDATVTAESVDDALSFTGSTQGLVKRNGDNSFVLDTSTYSTD